MCVCVWAGEWVWVDGEGADMGGGGGWGGGSLAYLKADPVCTGPRLARAAAGSFSSLHGPKQGTTENQHKGFALVKDWRSVFFAQLGLVCVCVCVCVFTCVRPAFAFVCL